MNKQIMAISVPSQSVFPQEHARAMARRQPLMERKAELTKQLEALNEQAADSGQSPPPG